MPLRWEPQRRSPARDLTGLLGFDAYLEWEYQEHGAYTQLGERRVKSLPRDRPSGRSPTILSKNTETENYDRQKSAKTQAYDA